MTTNPSDASQLAKNITTYFEAWHETTLEGCLKKLDQVLTPKISYRDPMFTHHTTRELAERIQNSRKNAPNFKVWVSTQIDGFDSLYRYGWTFTRDGGEEMEGLDIIDLDDSGRITSVRSFFASPVPRSQNEKIVQLPRFAPASS